MTLRRKTLSIVSLALVALVLVIFATAGFILSTSFANLQQQQATENMGRVLNAINGRIATQDTLTEDYAEWDDTYFFVTDPNQAYIDANFHDANFIDFGNSIVFIVNNDGEIVFSKAFDLQQEVEAPVPTQFEQILTPDSPLLNHPTLDHSVTGLINLPGQSIILSAHPILTSVDEGPINGTLIMGFPFDENEIAQLSELTNLSVLVHRVDDARLPADLRQVIAAVEQSEGVYFEPVNQNTLMGYTIVQDVYGNPALLVQVEIPRDIYQQGRTNLAYLLASLLVLGVVFVGLVIVLLERLVLARVANLSTAVTAIGASGDLAKRVPVTGQDELSSLAENINGMLQALTNSQIELQKAKETAEAANKAKTDFVSLVTHELRIPVTSIKGFADLLVGGYSGPINEAQNNFVDVIRNNADRMARLIADLADVSRIESGHLYLELGTVPLTAVLEETLRPLREQINQKQQTLIINSAETLPAVWADKARLVQILTNLLSNACKYTPEGGQITVSAVPVFAQGSPQSVHVTVQDTGIGMSPQDQQKVFEKFFRADNDHVQRIQGTGLGLHITRLLVEMQNGRIWFESQLGQGTAFHFTLPTAQSTPI